MASIEAALRREVARGTTELCLHRIEPQIGDCLFIPAGTVHALGAGLLVAEIQQSSDTTFRLFDWNRTDADGRPRELHVDQAIATIDYSRGPVSPQTPVATERPGVERLVGCDQFILDRWQIDTARPIADHPAGVHLLVVLAGRVVVDGDPLGQPMSVGQTMLVPHAAVQTSRIRPQGHATLLDIYLPQTDNCIA